MSEALVIGGTSFYRGLAEKHGISISNYKIPYHTRGDRKVWEDVLKLDPVDSLVVTKTLTRKNGKNATDKSERYINNALKHLNTTVSIKRTVIHDDDVLLITEVVRKY